MAFGLDERFLKKDKKMREKTFAPTKKRKKENTCITERTTKYTICPDCHLKIRCGNEEAHRKGWHHNNRGYVKR